LIRGPKFYSAIMGALVIVKERQGANSEVILGMQQSYKGDFTSNENFSLSSHKEALRGMPSLSCHGGAGAVWALKGITVK
jgi:hypothetical protein